jgi:hypothetical protein
VLAHASRQAEIWLIFDVEPVEKGRDWVSSDW